MKLNAEISWQHLDGIWWKWIQEKISVVFTFSVKFVQVYNIYCHCKRVKIYHVNVLVRMPYSLQTQIGLTYMHIYLYIFIYINIDIYIYMCVCVFFGCHFYLSSFLLSYSINTFWVKPVENDKNTMHIACCTSVCRKPIRIIYCRIEL